MAASVDCFACDTNPFAFDFDIDSLLTRLVYDDFVLIELFANISMNLNHNRY